MPIVIGGHSEAAAKRAGRLGDGFFPSIGAQVDTCPLFNVVRRAAAEAGRDPQAVEVSAGGAFDPAGIEKLRDMGVSRLMVPPLAFDADGIRGALEVFQENVISKVE